MSADGFAKPARVWTAVAVLAAAAYFVAFAWVGLGAYFTLDDGGNLVHAHGYWEHSLGEMAASVLQVATGEYRPVGGLFYLAIYRLAGFDPLPFRVVSLLLMLANVGIAFLVLRRLSGSVETAFLGTVFWAHHPALFQLLFNTGTIYEIICFLCYFAALGCCVKWRAEGVLSWRHVAALLVLDALALNSKEMAVTLPAAFLLIEIFYRRPGRWALGDILRQGRAVIATSLLTAIVMTVKLATYNPLSRDERYHIQVTLKGVIQALCRYFDSLLYRDQLLTPLGLLGICVSMAALAFALRSRAMKFGLAFLLISLLPVSIIPVFPNGFMLYLPMLGWALYWGALWTRCWEFVASRVPRNAGVGLRVAALAAIAVLIVTNHSAKRARFVEAMRVEQDLPRQMLRQLKDLRPRLEPGAQLLFLDDPLHPQDWSLLRFTQLAYHDPGIWVDRAKMLGAVPNGQDISLYDHVFTNQDGRLREVENPARRATPSGQPIQVRFAPAQVRPGEPFRVSVPQWAGETIDIAYVEQRRSVGHAGVGRRWCRLDANGSATQVAPIDIPAGRISIRRIRTQDGPWVPAEGTLTVLR